MSQSESKSKGSSLLMPLAIGGGLLLLMMGLNKAKAQSSGQLPALPEIDSADNAAASNQIVPQAAPKYTDTVDSQETSEEKEEEMDTSVYKPNPAPSYNPSFEEEPEEEAGSYPGYNPGNSSSKSTPASNSQSKWNERQPIPKVVGNGKPRMGMRQYADQNKKFTERAGTVNPKVVKMNSMRSASDQAKLAQQKARNTIPVPSPIPFIAQTQKIIAQKNAGNKIFPLKQGQTNNYIKEVQRKMGVSPTGFFGTQTKTALIKKYFSTEVSEALYKQIMSGKTILAKPIIPIKKKAPLLKRPVKVLRKK